MNPLLVFILVCVAIYIYEYRCGVRSSPAQLNVGFWSVVSISYILIGDRVEILSWPTVYVLILGVVSFWFGGKINLNCRLRMPEGISPDYSGRFFYAIVFFVLILGLFGTLWKALSYVPLVSNMPIFGGGGLGTKT